MKKMKFSCLVIFLFTCSVAFAKDVVIFPFYNKDGKDIPPASIGVLKSIMQFSKFFPSAKIVESSFDVKGRDVKEVIKATPGYDDYIIGYYTKKDNTFNYSVFIYDSKGNTIYNSSSSAEDLFDIADDIMTKIFSFYSGKNTGFANLNLNFNLNESQTYTILLNDEILGSVPGKTNISSKIISKVPYNIIVRNDETKEVVFSKTVVLLDNETISIQVNPEEKKVNEVETKPQIIETPKILPSQVYLNIKKSIETREIFDKKVFSLLKEEARILDLDTRIKIYKDHHISIGITILASGLNIIPGIGSLAIGDTGGFGVALFSPYLTLLSVSLFEENSPLRVVFSIISLIGYGYNLARPFIYSDWWNSHLKDLLSIPIKENLSLSIDSTKISFNIRL